MDADEYASLIQELDSLKLAKYNLQQRISSIEALLANLENERHFNSLDPLLPASKSVPPVGLTPQMVYRYSRHLLLPSFGVRGQSKLLQSSILVVGAGGLGSPALLYLAACGAGLIGIVDHDVVELNNMHRQVIHTEAYIGESKVESAATACRLINSSIRIVRYKEALCAWNALEIMSDYDIIVDATDNLPSRYLINDCCVLLGKPLVSGAALGLEGQLTVYNYKNGPCYRCLFPIPPPAAACQGCSDTGVLGVVPGVIGCLQALEAIKLGSGVGEPLSARMLLFDALSSQIRIVKLRHKSPQCEVCGDNASFSKERLKTFDYESFTQSSTPPALLLQLPEDARISARDYGERVKRKEPHVLVDVRPRHHFEIASLPNAISIPLSSLDGHVGEISSAVQQQGGGRVYVVCGRGNDSQKGVHYLRNAGFPHARDIVGGLQSWACHVDPNFPAYW